MNGTQTLGEDQADIVGMKLAYNAYRRWTHQHGAEKPLPGVILSPKQSFWFSTAQRRFCSVYTPDALAKLIRSDVHTIDEFRVIGPLSNLADFANDFNCPVGTPMNPAKKCELW